MLFCEGRNTEPAYFKALRRHAFPNTLVDVKIAPGVGVPMTIAKCAKECAKSQRRNKKGASFAENDSVWAVFDRDKHPRFDEAVNLCREHDIDVARSDPCFELWLVLHEQDYDKPCSCDEVQRKLEDLRPEYDRNSAKMPDCDNLMNRIEEAEQRAERQLSRRREEGCPCGNPSTTVFQLTRAIRVADEAARP